MKTGGGGKTWETWGSPKRKKLRNPGVLGSVSLQELFLPGAAAGKKRLEEASFFLPTPLL